MSKVGKQASNMREKSSDKIKKLILYFIFNLDTLVSIRSKNRISKVQTLCKNILQFSSKHIALLIFPLLLFVK